MSFQGQKQNRTGVRARLRVVRWAVGLGTEVFRPPALTGNLRI